MAKPNRGKQFEKIFEKDWIKTFPKTLVLRLKDDVSGYYGTGKNPCDFICHPDNNVYMIETKTHYENRFPFKDFSQYDTLLAYQDCLNTKIGLVVWFIDYDLVLYFPLQTITKMKDKGLKSINLRHLTHEEYEYIEIPSVKKRVFMESDYSILLYN